MGDQKKLKKGLIHVYTGDGKGKTTSAVGQAIRALGHGLKVGMIFFHKNFEKWGYGEINILEDLGVKIKECAGEHPQFSKEVSEENLRKQCLEGLEYIREIFRARKLDLLILDEIILSVRDGFIKESELLDLLEEKPEGMELILTGREASEDLMEKADYVTENKEVKHPFNEGMEGREGIEY